MLTKPDRFFSMKQFLLVLTFLPLAICPCFGQTTAARPDRGMIPNGAYAVSDIENISLQNGNVNLTIPLASLPPIAGGKLSWTISAYYNSKVWDIGRTQWLGQGFGYHPYVVDTPQTGEAGGWRITEPYRIEIRDAHLDFDYQLPEVADEPDYSLLQNYNWYKVILRTPDGSEHELRPTNYQYSFSGGKDFLKGYYRETPATIGTMRYYSFDG